MCDDVSSYKIFVYVIDTIIISSAPKNVFFFVNVFKNTIFLPLRIILYAPSINKLGLNKTD